MIKIDTVNLFHELYHFFLTLSDNGPSFFILFDHFLLQTRRARILAKNESYRARNLAISHSKLSANANFVNESNVEQKYYLTMAGWKSRKPVSLATEKQ